MFMFLVEFVLSFWMIWHSTIASRDYISEHNFSYSTYSDREWFKGLYLGAEIFRFNLLRRV
ncbi:hypothetical protein LguiA_003128 [Lonicera macranthoides]